ncbi:MAG: tRNA (adenosine(37)-N6)-threonylcarbamoyltransferase complex dimerization subunit type 1 TsaB [Desulfobaccales bacterium]|nr:tRNA (adenosine(37)-N6)-threonylcarbamoyltransferase complex dimerization subunit type 1 TsaB [Desulfobaccales bacterium]
MLILALDTATEQGSLALVAADRLLLEYSLESPGAYLTRLMPGVEALLQATGRRLEEVGAIAVSQGPGNFTGLRLGLATAKGLAWALACPLVAVPTLEVLAAQLPFQPHPVGVLLDAKRQEVFFGLFRGRPERPEPLADPIRLPVSLLPPRLKPPLTLTGPGLNAYRDFLEEVLPRDIHWAPPEIRYPRAFTVARLARWRLEQGLTTPPAQLTPTYLRPAL